MVDISKCANETCPEKLNCFRYTANPSDDWQSYAMFTYTITAAGDHVCGYQIHTAVEAYHAQY